MSGWTAERETELRAAGWSDGEIGDYRQGFTSALAAVRTPAPSPEGRGWLPVADHFPARSERGRWQSETFAGALSRLLPATDDAAVLAEARKLQDDREYTYGNRPPLAPCLVAVRHASPRGMALSGTTNEIAQLFRNAGIAVRVGVDYDPPALAGGQPQVTRV